MFNHERAQRQMSQARSNRRRLQMAIGIFAASIALASLGVIAVVLTITVLTSLRTNKKRRGPPTQPPASPPKEG